MSGYFRFFTDDSGGVNRYGSAMDGTIYDEATTPVLAFDGGAETARATRADLSARAGNKGPEQARIVVISNPRSHRNKRRPLRVPSGVGVEEPRTRSELRQTLVSLARDGIDLLIVAGGDGTVRDVLTYGVDVWGENPPAIGVLPCGKTNALAIDLGVPDQWGVTELVNSWREGCLLSRPPIEIVRTGEDRPVLGFLFGAGAFVDATDMAQATHQFGAVNNLAVALSTLGAVTSTIVGGDNSPWRQGKHMAIRFGKGARARHGAVLDSEGRRFIMLASTMERLPMGLGVFGERRPGLKTLVVDAPPRRFLRNFIRVARGRDWPRMERDGIHRIDATEISVDLEGGFVLDGERFPAGSYVMCEGAPISFVTS